MIFFNTSHRRKVPALEVHKPAMEDVNEDRVMELERKAWHLFRKTGSGTRGTLCFWILMSLVFVVPIML